MPNPGFCAVHTDFHAVLDYVFARSGCCVFESYSAFDQDLVEFTRVDDVMAQLPVGVRKGDTPSALLSLLIPGATSLFQISRIGLMPGRPDDHRFQPRNRRLGL